MSIAVIGSNMVDLVSYIERMPQLGETVEAQDFMIGCGGKGANQATAAARLGSEVFFVTRIGNDMFAQKNLSNFKANGINTEYVLETDCSSGVAPIFVDQQSHNSILIIKGANAQLTPSDVHRAERKIAQAKLIVLQLEIPLDTVYAAIEVGNKHRVPILLNPAPADPDLDPYWVAKCDYFVPNETELATLTNHPVGTMEQVKGAAHQLLKSGCPHVIVTLGEKGALLVTAEKETLIPAYPVRAIDTTGAGDAFIGCLAHFLERGESLEIALAQANRYAANSVTKRGTQSAYATCAELEAWLHCGNN